MAGWLPLFAPAASSSFTPAWQDMRLGGGGNVTSISAYGTTLLSTNDTNGAHSYVPSGTFSFNDDPNATAFDATGWKQVVTQTSLPSGAFGPTDLGQAGAQFGCVAYKAAPSNTSIRYMIWYGKVYYSTNSGSTWTAIATSITSNGWHGNAPPALAKRFLAIDPNNPDHVWVSTDTNGVWTTTGGTTGGTWTKHAGITVSSGGGHAIVFDSSSSFSGGKTQRILVATQGGGTFESTDGGSTFGASIGGTSTTTLTDIICDKFGVFHAVDVTNGRIVRRTTGTWSTVYSAGSSPASIAADPSAASQGAETIVALTYAGEPLISTNGGTSYTSPGGSSFSKAASGSQPLWINVTYPTGSGVFLNLTAVDIDTGGTVWAASGIGVFKTALSGIATSPFVWNADTVGIEQLVGLRVLCPLNNGPIASFWDRGFFRIVNPDTFPTKQYTQSAAIVHGWGLDVAKDNNHFFVGVMAGDANVIAKSTDGGDTWSTATLPNGGTGWNNGCKIAVSTASNYICHPAPGQSLYYTTNGASSWNTSSIAGSPAIQTSYFEQNQPLAADAVTANKFYLVSQAQGFYSSTDSGATFSAGGSFTGMTSETPFVSKLIGVPGNAGHILYSPGSQSSSTAGGLWKSTDSGANWTRLANIRDVICFGVGAALPGGSGYPTIYALGYLSGTYGLYYSTDGGSNWSSLNGAPAGQVQYPGNTCDLPKDITGDMSAFGRIFVTLHDAGGVYIDMQNACPSVHFTNVKPTQALSGTVSLQASKSGLVPVTSAEFKVDGSSIATFSGNGPYSTSWNASGVSVGSHTLTVVATGANGTSTRDIPITTS